ncbi:(E3-independent) E2 ubiquitin-conjugating enzyme [Uranotaenia lowii]|uniref:(E3-independent) E2 ubiquitin-conjugating enzyme n=1 Tax=Uranotaenia lowii TaxID=190385 RepID=UPI00247A02F0|nr:(E3-independent) E2 ubiquitin-conjugating enzyme [Uranotaenia lowii]XP_055590424.1 (E3-independent) E2 ubiquitin-conjugating enzyme [Uranotaenia lowii]
MASNNSSGSSPGLSTKSNKVLLKSSSRSSQLQQQQQQDDPSPENQYFYEDEIFCIDGKGHVKFGLVLENFEVSEEEGFDEDALKKGEIRACWHPEGLEEIVRQNRVGLADRTLMPGDVVRRMIPGKDTQRGYCHEIFVKADVKIVGSKYVVKNVPSERLRPLMSMPKDNAVCYDSWVGSTKNVNEKLILKSQCGSLVELRPDIDYCSLKDSDTRSRCGFFAGTLFYPGQTLIGPISELENAKWLSTSPEMKINRKHKLLERKFTVQSVEIEGVWVQWQCKASSCDDIEAEMKNGAIQQPPDYITGDDLKRLRKLNLFESCMLQINDKNYLKLEDGDAVCRKSLWRKELSSRYRRMLSTVSSGEMEEEVICDTDNHKITVTGSVGESESREKVDPDKGKLCPTGGKEGLKLGKMRRNSPRRLGANAVTCKLAESDEWQTDPEDDEEEETCEGCESAMSDGGGSTISSCSSTATPRGSPKKSPLLAKKLRKGKFKRSASANSSNERIPAAGDEVITETLVVYSTATVVWQDGTIETNIPSTDLCPIHHLDDHEFFPGDFVLAGNTDPMQNPSFRDYGVIQNVDHHGRTAKVKWFSTYTCAEEPQPTFNGESEVSVYDLKDHPDFQYRPGTIVIRVANFQGDDSNCTAGQVIDNYPNGMVKVWWVDDHISMCWPQDIFEVGQYDSENNFWGNNDSDNNSWETEDETSELGGTSPERVSKPKLAANLERARVAMARLEELFIINPHLQNHEVMKKLLLVYKKCRYLDRLMDTTFFHEEHFMGLVERVRKSNNQTTAERVLEQKNRLFNQSGSKTTTPTTETPSTAELKLPSMSNNSLSTSTGACAVQLAKTSTTPNKQTNSSSSFHIPTNGNNQSTSSEISSIDEYQLMATSTSTSCSTRSTGENGTGGEDSGNFSARSDPGANASDAKLSASIGNDSALNTELDNVNNLYMNMSDEMNNTSSVFSFSPLAENVSAKLCSLIKIQLVKALQEINSRFSQSDSFKEIIVEEIQLTPPPINSSRPLSSTPSLLLQSNLNSPTTVESVESNDDLPLSIPAAPGELNFVECFQIMDSAPSTHKFHLTVFQTSNAQSFYRAVQREHKLLRTGLPPGVWVRTFEDRLDLLSVMIEGPKKTPYEDGLFLFDIQLGQDYPASPPLCHYISYCSDRLNPNLYEDGKVCVSLLGTWSGRGTEVWGSNSTLLQVIVSIQGLILVDEPYFNEAGYEKQRGSQQGKENSRMYNEMVLLKLVQSMTKLVANPPEIFSDQILQHFRQRGLDMYQRIKRWMDVSVEANRLAVSRELESLPRENESEIVTSAAKNVDALLASSGATDSCLPDFPLIPASRGFCLTLAGLLEIFQKILHANGKVGE